MNPKTTTTLANLYPSWRDLTAHRSTWESKSLNQLFSEDDARGKHLTLEAAGLYLDYSKNHLTADTLELLRKLAEEAGIPAAIKALVTGEHVNNTEKRPALHTALRFQGDPKTPEEKAVFNCRQQISRFVDSIHSGEWKGFNEEAITDIVNIGIGGSDLGPRMATDALSPYHSNKVRVHFVANIDGAAINDIFNKVNPRCTLFIVASKSFSTLETIENANTARTWLREQGCPEDKINRHFIAISSNIEKAVAFGIGPDNIFPMWDWVGGRYSLWSAIGLPIALATGMEHFNELLAGAHSMDEHFATAEPTENMPALMALITFWYSQFWNAQSQAVIPYSHHMHYFPEFLQQLDMESLGKSVCSNGNPLNDRSGLVIWGAEGSNGQHSFHQLLHQGNHCVPVDFIATLTSRHNFDLHHQQLFACCISQSQALMKGKSLGEAYDELRTQGSDQEAAQNLAPHKVIPGNRPSNTLIIERLTPRALGALIALYEHKVYCLSTLLQINAFDQWGVELGKQLGSEVFAALQQDDSSKNHSSENWDSSTKELIAKFKRN